MNKFWRFSDKWIWTKIKLCTLIHVLVCIAMHAWLVIEQNGENYKSIQIFLRYHNFLIFFWGGGLKLPVYDKISRFNSSYTTHFKSFYMNTKGMYSNAFFILCFKNNFTQPHSSSAGQNNIHYIYSSCSD